MKIHNVLRVLALVGALGFQHHCGGGNALRAEPANPKSITGTVADFKMSTLEIAVKSDRGESVLFSVGPDTEVVQIAPGEHDLSRGKPAKVTDLARGDRVLVSFVSGLTEARRIVLMSSTDIAARNQAERDDWQKRGLTGAVLSREGDRVTLEVRKPQGAETVIVSANSKTRVRRYAADSVSFADAEPSRLDVIAKGDQVRVRGSRSEDGANMEAEDLVFGTFVSKVGKITSIDSSAREIQMLDSATEKPVTVRLIASSQVKMLPDMKTMFVNMLTAGGGHGQQPDHAQPGPDPQRTMATLPAAKLEDLQPGTSIIVTSTVGSREGRVTAILIMANADALIQMARSQPGKGNSSPSEALSGLHGGMMSSPGGGLNIPTILP